MSTEKDFERAHARALRATVKISDELDSMVRDLPETVASQYVLETIIIPELMRRQRLMRLIMEDHDTREAYYEALAHIPAKPRRPS
jgi:hypothetical protein